MKLYLARHGQAMPEVEDPFRPLTQRGRREIAESAESAARLSAKASLILHSGKARARETAEILAARLGWPLRPAEGLLPNDPVEPWLERELKEEEDLMLVGHLPFMEKLASALLTGSPEGSALEFRTGAIACLEREGGRWRLLWLVEPRA